MSRSNTGKNNYKGYNIREVAVLGRARVADRARGRALAIAIQRKRDSEALLRSLGLEPEPMET